MYVALCNFVLYFERRLPIGRQAPIAQRIEHSRPKGKM